MKKLTQLTLLLSVLFVGCSKNENLKEKDAPATISTVYSVMSYPQNPYPGNLVFGASAGAGGGISSFESDLRAHGANPEFRFGGIRSYLKYDSDFDTDLLPYTPLQQGAAGRQYIPLISLRTKKGTTGTHVLYPEVWAGANDANWKKQFDQIATQYGTKGSPVSGPAGNKAYPVILTFNHEFDLGSESGDAYDPNNSLTRGQQFSKAFRYVQNLQRSYKLGLNVKWTWIPTAYSVKKYTGSGMNPMFEYWPSRNTDGTGGSVDDGTPNLSNVSRVDIMGCDAYMNDFVFAEAVNYGGINGKGSFINMTNSVGTAGLPWLLGEYGVDERCGDANWKKNTFNTMMSNLNTADYQQCVWISIWPTASTNNDNRWDSGPKNSGSCSYGTPNPDGISALGFTSNIQVGVSLPGGRPNIFGL